MRLHHLILALGALSITASLVSPAQADQSFGSVSTAPVNRPAPTPTYGNIQIEYMYYPCTDNNGRFYPYDPRTNGNTSRVNRPTQRCQAYSHGPHQPHPPHHPPPKRYPVAQHT